VNFGFSDEQDQLQSAVADFLKNETPTTFARQMADSADGMTDAVWRNMAQLGWLGLTVPESHGGSGLGCLDLAIVVEEMGGVALPGPYFSTVALTLPSILRFGSDQDRDRYCAPIAEGRLRATVAWAESSGVWGTSDLTCRAATETDGFVLNGDKLFVPDAGSADVIFVVAGAEEGVGLFAVPRDCAGVAIEPMRGIDETRKIDTVALRDVAVGADALLGRRMLEAQELGWIVDVAKTMLCAEMCGAASAVLDLAVDYAKIREQFGRPIGSFQAIQHQLADMKVALENARSLTYYAAWALDNDAEDAHLACAMAKAYAGDACVKAVADGIQVHGGIGFTWEHDAQLFYKRVKSSELTFGDGDHNREMVADLLAL